jgi:hypothetical protein
MKTLRFYFIKLFILLLVNMIVFAVSFALLQILKLENMILAYMINSFVSSVIFWIYTYKTSRTMKNPDGLTNLQFTLREMSVYFILIVIVTVCSLIDSGITNAVFTFFLPNSFFFYLTDNSIFGGLLQIVWYGVIVFVSRITPKRISKQ